MTYYKCDYIKLPFEDVIKIVFGKRYPHSSFAVSCYKRHKYIYQSSGGAIYGAEAVSYNTIVKLSSVLKDIELGRL